MLKINQHPKYQIISLVVRGGRLLSVGTNKQAAPKRFTKPHRQSMSLHSEIDAILGLSKESTKGSTLYIIGQTAKGNKMNVKPCLTCQKVCDTLGLKRIVYQDMEKLIEY